MTLLAVERMKLFSTRSPWWCMAAAIVVSVGLTALLVANLPSGAVSIGATQAFGQFAMMIIMVMAALSVTTEYRFGTIRATFQAVPNRTSVLLAKSVTVGLLAGITGLIVSFGSFGISMLFATDSGLSISTATDWRALAGPGLAFFVGAVLAVAIGALLRQPSAAISLIVLWSLMIESLIPIIPGIGADLQPWLPFYAVNHFLLGELGDPNLAQMNPALAADTPYSPWFAIGYFAAFTLAMLVLSIIVTNRRDA
ncbi:hypothetical protein [Actinoalloteichus hymeniacidonis]|uniref:ABC-2 family transporter protein n=1 Tax=Actinoalloteichus hymeniacidonis TaxID=340345 RepID=A0AAC9HVE8_9PSEU|nr:hypothetical protein [Actinoalloteichus hymeniacidonis]AOS66025.1 ABC-2 family transporter protein [Actinoalloteichus hymeniacidonis]MBB5905873.1 ABC-2 type transport system permease protein [Actinoalloteichus hymeniacidonis]